MTRKYRNKIEQKTFHNFIKEAKSFYDKKLFTDVTLQCEGEIFSVHKLVLVANSPYFKNYFNQERNSSMITMLVDFTTSEVLQIILNYFYTGRINLNKEQSQELLKSLIEASIILQLPLLSNYILELLLKKTSREISLSDWKYVEELESKIISDLFIENIAKKLATLNTTLDFLQLSPNQIKLLLKCPRIAESDQEIIFQSILNWVKHDSDERKEQLTELLESFVDLHRISATKLVEVKNEKLLKENNYFLKFYFEVASPEMTQKKKIAIKKKLDLKKTYAKFLMDFEDQDSKESSENNLEIDIRKNSILFRNPMEGRQFFIYDSKSEDKCQSFIYLYDYVKDQLDEIIPHPLTDRRETAVTFHEGSIYSFGGECLSDKFMSRELCSYNMKTKQWLEKKMMSKWKMKSVAIKLNDYIYVLGGINEESTQLKCVERYNPTTDEWKFVAALPDTNNGTVPVVAVNGCLYAWIKNKLYRYFPEDDKWFCVRTNLRKHLNTGEIHMSEGNGKIFIIEKVSPKAVWIFDPKENSLNEDILPAVLTKCDGIINLENPGNLEFLVSGNKRWFIYRPALYTWTPFDPKKLKDFEISMLTLIT